MLSKLRIDTEELSKNVTLLRANTRESIKRRDEFDAQTLLCTNNLEKRCNKNKNDIASVSFKLLDLANKYQTSQLLVTKNH